MQFLNLQTRQGFITLESHTHVHALVAEQPIDRPSHLLLRSSNRPHTHSHTDGAAFRAGSGFSVALNHWTNADLCLVKPSLGTRSPVTVIVSKRKTEPRILKTFLGCPEF